MLLIVITSVITFHCKINIVTFTISIVVLQAIGMVTAMICISTKVCIYYFLPAIYVLMKNRNSSGSYSSCPSTTDQRPLGEGDGGGGGVPDVAAVDVATKGEIDDTIYRDRLEFSNGNKNVKHVGGHFGATIKLKNKTINNDKEYNITIKNEIIVKTMQKVTQFLKF